MARFFRLFHPALVVLLGCAILANIFMSHYTRDMKAKWVNVPLPPSSLGISSAFLGDRELAFRSSAMALQSFGNETGQVQALKDYNYDHLGKWFDMEDQLNHRSDYVPFLAAYYFGATQDPSQLGPVIAYLRQVGKNPEGEKWRWLGQAVYLARHKMKDNDLALQLAEELADTYRPGMPAWPLQMKAIIASDIGDKDLAYSMMVEMLRTSSESMHPNEVNFMLDYICNTILSPVQKGRDALCKDQ
ncbi:MAG: hypothetical protein AUJ12_01390 [Alphaproteobacteria bacterium CG1_02_46_17]|nr:MAG: hypothetical protein AUJ12_01390 [Alphaproteobacteria bacterium CG1_02_46_17]